MDFVFHLQQGNKLLETQDADSVRKAVEHFVAANAMTEEDDISKPQTLYHLAYVNLSLGNVAKAYQLAYKARRSVALARQSSFIVMDKWPGEERIEELIEYIEANFPFEILFIDTSENDVDENNVDLSNLYRLYKNVAKTTVVPGFKLERCSKDLLMATFFAMCADGDSLLFFDKQKGDVLQYVEGYFSSHLGNQEHASRELYNKIVNSEPNDEVNEERHVRIPRLLLKEFLSEFEAQAGKIEPFASFAATVGDEICKEFSTYNKVTVDELYASSYVLQKFETHFAKQYLQTQPSLRGNYNRIYEASGVAIARRWIQAEIFNGIDIVLDESDQVLDFEFISSDHIRYQGGLHVSGPHGGARRLIKVVPDEVREDCITVTIYNLDGNHPLWQNNIQMAPKQMKVVGRTDDKVVLRGYGYDPMGEPFANYGLTIHFDMDHIHKCELHMHDRDIDIEYLS